MKNSRSLVTLWAPFACACLLTFVAYKTLWATQWYWTFLSLLGVLSCLLAFRVLKKTGLKWWSIASVTIGLLMGQWWFVERLILRIFWQLNGFAP